MTVIKLIFYNLKTISHLWLQWMQDIYVAEWDFFNLLQQMQVVKKPSIKCTFLQPTKSSLESSILIRPWDFPNTLITFGVLRQVFTSIKEVNCT